MIVLLSTAGTIAVILVLVVMMMRKVKSSQRRDADREAVVESHTQTLLNRAKDDLIARSHDLNEELELLRLGRASRR